MYTETLSSSFSGMSFPQAAEICFVKLKLLLVAIEVKDKEENDAKIAINPRQARASTFTIGYFLAQSAGEVKRANFYCKGCHEDIKDEALVTRCMCKQLVDVAVLTTGSLSLKEFQINR